jgi:hypothetical protein
VLTIPRTARSRSTGLAVHDRRNTHYIDETIATLSERIDEVIAPFAEELARLDSIYGVAQRTAEVLIAELGVDMGQFPSDRHLASWAGLCPGNNESAGKHKFREDAAGQSLAAGRPDRGRPGRDSDVQQRVRGPLPADHAAPRS